MDTLKERGVQYISGRIIRENDAVMFDIDDTPNLYRWYTNHSND